MSEGTVTVHLYLDGESQKPKEIGFNLAAVTVNVIENYIRSSFGVVNGVLSCFQDKIQAVIPLTAGEVYYFVDFRRLPGKHIFSNCVGTTRITNDFFILLFSIN